MGPGFSSLCTLSRRPYHSTFRVFPPFPFWQHLSGFAVNAARSAYASFSSKSKRGGKCIFIAIIYDLSGNKTIPFVFIPVRFPREAKTNCISKHVFGSAAPFVRPSLFPTPAEKYPKLHVFSRQGEDHFLPEKATSSVISAPFFAN